MTPAEKLLTLKKEHQRDAQHTINAFCDAMEGLGFPRYRFGRFDASNFFCLARPVEDADQIDAVYNALLTRKLMR